MPVQLLLTFLYSLELGTSHLFEDLLRALPVRGASLFTNTAKKHLLATAFLAHSLRLETDSMCMWRLATKLSVGYKTVA